MGRLSRLLGAATAPPSLSRDKALTAVEGIGAVSALISSLEYLAAESDRKPGGLNNWEVGRGLTAGNRPAMRKLFDVVGDRRVTKAIHWARVGAATSLLAPT